MNDDPIKLLVLNTKDDARRIYGDIIDSPRYAVTYVHAPPIDVQKLLDDNRPDVVMLSLEWLELQRTISYEATQREIPVLYVMDGILEWSYVWDNQTFVKPSGTVLQPLIAGNIATIGRHPSRILAACGIRDKIRIVGLPRLDHFSRVRMLEHGRMPRLLVCTATTPSHNQLQRLNILKAVSDIRAATKHMPIEIIWRIDDQIARDLKISNQRSTELEPLLRTCDGLISSPSTVLLEGMMKGIPTAVIEYRTVPLYCTTAWEIRSEEQIAGVIKELLYPPPEKLAYQAFCLNEELEPGEASGRLDLLIQSLATNVPEHPAANGRDAYGALDFHLVHQQISCFSASDATIRQYMCELYSAREARSRKLRQTLEKTWLIRLARVLRKFPMFRRFNRLLDEIY